MAEEIAFENGRISDFKGIVTLTLDEVILHTGVHHSLTCTYKPNFIKIKETFVDGRTYRQTFETGFCALSILTTSFFAIPSSSSATRDCHVV